MAQIRERLGNLFDSQYQAVVNTVNTAGVMGRGIALEFRYRYPDMFKDYLEACKAGRIRIGNLTVWKKTTPWVVNFPTKEDWRLPSRLEYIEAGLRRFREFYREEGIQSISFPPLGASLGRLDWDQVKELMWKWLEPLPDLTVEIVRYDESASDKWFDTLRENTRGWSPYDFQNILKLGKKEASLVARALKESSCSQMMHLQSIKGLGERSFEKLYGYVRDLLRGAPPPVPGLFK